MTQAMSDAGHLQALRPLRVLEELSSHISETAPIVLHDLHDQIRPWEKSIPPNASSEYARDYWQRSVLLLDILSQRGNLREQMLATIRLQF